MHRKSSLRDALGSALIKKEKRCTGKLRGRYLFRAAVRLVFEYMDWIKGESMFEDIGNDVAANVRIAQRKKSQEKKSLTMEVERYIAKYYVNGREIVALLSEYNKNVPSVQDRAALLTKIYQRCKEDRVHILNLIKSLRAFRKYPENLKPSVAAVCQYQYLGPGRVIVRQGHPPSALYYIVKGEVTLTKVVTDHVTGDITEVTIGTMGPGDMFGEIALLHSIARTTTVTSKTPLDLFYIDKTDFDRILKHILLQDWNVLQDALITFNYFKTWDEDTIRECCILSKIKNFEPNEVLLGDGKGMVNYVYFLLAGECRLTEHMIIHEEKCLGKVNYRLYKPEERERSTLGRIQRTSRRGTRETKQSIEVEGHNFDEKVDEPIDYAQLMLSARPTAKVDTERMSVITTTLQDVVNQWHEITDVAAMLMREPSVSSQDSYPKGVRTIFMQICKFYRGACFGLGEQMRNRRIVSLTPVRCLLVPRYWLLEHNRANIWQRVKLFMESKYPSPDELFNHFITNRRWINFKRGLLAEIIRNGRNVPNDTTFHDVPYSIRINEEIDEA